MSNTSATEREPVLNVSKDRLRVDEIARIQHVADDRLRGDRGEQPRRRSPRSLRHARHDAQDRRDQGCEAEAGVDQQQHAATLVTERETNRR
jgi:hypothetical protein